MFTAAAFYCVSVFALIVLLFYTFLLFSPQTQIDFQTLPVIFYNFTFNSVLCSLMQRYRCDSEIPWKKKKKKLSKKSQHGFFTVLNKVIHFNIWACLEWHTHDARSHAAVCQQKQEKYFTNHFWKTSEAKHGLKVTKQNRFFLHVLTISFYWKCFWLLML